MFKSIALAAVAALFATVSFANTQPTDAKAPVAAENKAETEKKAEEATEKKAEEATK